MSNSRQLEFEFYVQVGVAELFKVGGQEDSGRDKDGGAQRQAVQELGRERGRRGGRII